MSTFRTRGQASAVAAAGALLAGGLPHALLLVGPPSVGKTTLALDLAAGLLCRDPDPALRPCRACRGCRLVEHGNHPDLHRVMPEGAAGQILIGPVRALLEELALLPVEGTARVAVIEAAHAMNEPAQNALLKTLEEPPPGLTIILAADDEDALLPTVRSRCARLRLGPLPFRALADLLVDGAGIDPVDAARIARLSAGRAGAALAYARNADALVIRTELSRSLLDLFGSGRATRLATIRELLVRAGQLRAALLPPAPDDGSATPPAGRRGRRVSKAPASPAPAIPVDGAGPGGSNGGPDGPDAEERGVGTARVPAAERRRAAAVLVATWRDVVADLARVQLGDPAAVREPDLLEEYLDHARHLPPATIARFLGRLDDAALRLEASGSAELVLDVLAVTLPRGKTAAA